MILRDLNTTEVEELSSSKYRPEYILVLYRNSNDYSYRNSKGQWSVLNVGKVSESESTEFETFYSDGEATRYYEDNIKTYENIFLPSTKVMIAKVVKISKNVVYTLSVMELHKCVFEELYYHMLSGSGKDDEVYVEMECGSCGRTYRRYFKYDRVEEVK